MHKGHVHLSYFSLWLTCPEPTPYRLFFKGKPLFWQGQSAVCVLSDLTVLTEVRGLLT